jgi:hypothetical protein
MCSALDIDDMRGQCFHVAERTRFRTSQVAVAHQRDTLTIDTDDAV